MGSPRGNTERYFGKSGELAVLSEFLARQYNVAVPQVDMGQDVLVIRDSNMELWPIQVKSAKANPYESGDGWWALVNIDKAALSQTEPSKLVYVFPIRLKDKWVEFIVISRYGLSGMVDEETVGSLRKYESGRAYYQFRFMFKGKALNEKKTDLTRYMGAFKLEDISFK